MPGHVYGTPFKSFAIPIKEGNTVLGVVVFGKSLEKKNSLNVISKEVVNNLSEISTVMDTVSQGVQSLALMNEDLLEESSKTKLP